MAKDAQGHGVLEAREGAFARGAGEEAFAAAFGQPIIRKGH